jgi:hypothetical protein
LSADFRELLRRAKSDRLDVADAQRAHLMFLQKIPQIGDRMTFQIPFKRVNPQFDRFKSGRRRRRDTILQIVPQKRHQVEGRPHMIPFCS